ncbi:MAG TPA: tetratricopeptide repeat protein [Pyrinomonadaceae bacterium]|nr:tetratricopeptide repeat protein [Pyrinomonadaceae bacterium]
MKRTTVFAGLVLLAVLSLGVGEITEPRAVASGTNTRLRLNESCVLNPLATARGSVTQVAQRPGAGSAATGRTLTVVTEPAAIVWLDEVRRGTTDESGKLALSKVTAGAHTLRVRANGFKEITMPVAAAARGEIPVRLTRTTDQAELIFQRAETARESARTDESRQQAAELYRQALQARAAFPAAHVGLARVLLDLNNSDGALNAIEAARGTRPSYPEASAVEGRIYREIGQTDEAIGSFNRAIRESRGFQPEAHVGLGRIYEEKGEYELSAREFQIAVNQLADTEPIIYQMLGAAYEKAGNPKEAIVAYENYLRLAPNGSLAPAVQSIVEQLKSAPPPEY